MMVIMMIMMTVVMRVNINTTSRWQPPTHNIPSQNNHNCNQSSSLMMMYTKIIMTPMILKEGCHHQDHPDWTVSHCTRGRRQSCCEDFPPDFCKGQLGTGQWPSHLRKQLLDQHYHHHCYHFHHSAIVDRWGQDKTPFGWTPLSIFQLPWQLYTYGWSVSDRHKNLDISNLLRPFRYWIRVMSRQKDKTVENIKTRKN